SEDPDFPSNYGVTGFVTNFQALGHYFNTSDNRIMTLASITDGLSNTIFTTEKMTVCVNSTYAGTIATGEPATDAKYYNIWAYGRTAWPEWNPVFGYMVTGPASKFQVTPTSRGDNATCDPRYPTAPRTAGILVGLGDGSVRLVSSSVSPNTWWWA